MLMKHILKSCGHGWNQRWAKNAWQHGFQGPGREQQGAFCSLCILDTSIEELLNEHKWINSCLLSPFSSMATIKTMKGGVEMGGKEERGKDGKEKMKARAGSVISQCFQGLGSTWKKTRGGVSCWHVIYHYLPWCLTAVSRAVGRRKLACCHLLKLQSKNRYWYFECLKS